MSESAPSKSSDESSPSLPTTKNEDSSGASPSPPSGSSTPDSPPSKSSKGTPPTGDDSPSSSPPPSKSDTSPPSNSNSSPPSPPSNSKSSPPSPPSKSGSSLPSPPSGSSPPSLESPPESSDSPPNNSNQSNSSPTKSSPPGKKTTPSQSSDSPPTQKSPPPPSKTPSSKQSPPSDVPTPPTKNNNGSPSKSSPSQVSDSTPRLSPPSTKSNSGSSKQASSKSSSESSKDYGQGVVVGVTLLGVATIMLFAILCIILRKKKKRREEAYMDHYRPPNSLSGKSDGYYHGQPAAGNSANLDPYYGMKSHGPYSGGHGSNYGSNRGPGPGLMDPNVMGNSKSWFSYEELMDITDGFSRQNVLGEGGFGCVYKGQLQDGKEVAVKQLKAGSGQGEREFQAEVEIISRVHHRHLVSLVGYCIAEHHRLLVYEFVANDTLEHHLHGKGNVFIDWPKRVKIAIGAAKGLAYLHEDCHPRIIHRDIKSANILLDNSFEAQVADFGLAKLSNDTHTHVSTRVMGTFGYLAPEYASSGKLTDRSDVFSFGVVLLEIVTGRRPVDASQPLGEESLVEWARPLLIRALETGEFGDLVDPRLENKFKTNEMFRMIEVAAACVRHSSSKRPRMVQVVRALDSEGDMVDLTNGVKFGQSTIFEAGQYSVDIRRFQRMAFGSEDLSSDYGQSGEYDRKSSTYSAEYRSREMPQRPPNPWKGEPTSGEYPNSSESETLAIFPHGSGRSSDEFHANYGYNRR